MILYDAYRMTPGFSTLLFSDFHAGHHLAHRQRKFRALEAMMAQAHDRNVTEIVLAGDIADERPDRARVREECLRLCEAIDGHTSIFLRGNHDDAAFFDASEIEDLLRCTVHELPWHVSPVSGVVVTHGHHFRSPATRRALRRALPTSTDPDASPSTHRLKIPASYRMAGRFGFALEHVGLPSMHLWDHLLQVSQRSRRTMAKTLRPNRRSPLEKRSWRERMADAIDLRSIRHAARLARATQCWGAVTGHTHVPGIYKHYLRDDRTGDHIPFLVGNSGSFVSRYAPTCIEVRYPHMILWQYDPRTHRMSIVQDMRLSPEELALQKRVLGM